MSNINYLENLVNALNHHHINLYHDVSKKEIDNYITNNKDISNLKRIDSDYAILKLFNKFHDSHTRYFYTTICTNKEFLYLNKMVYVNIKNQYYEVKDFAEISASTVVKKLQPIILGWETNVYKEINITNALNNFYCYQLIKLTKTPMLNFTYYKNGKEIQEQLQAVLNNDIREVDSYKEKEQNYFFKILQDNILYIKYNSCRDDFYYPMEVFIKEIQKELDEKNITKYILDIRSNSGGDSSSFSPFEKLVKERNLKGVIVVNKRVCSAAAEIVMHFKRDFNAYIIGDIMASATKFYGMGTGTYVDNSYISYSTILYDFTNVFNYSGSIKPDKLVETNIEDLNNHYDRQLDEAIKKLNK